MKYTIIVLVSLMFGCSTTPYVKFDVGYTIHEYEIPFQRGIDKSEDYKMICNVEGGLKLIYDFTIIGGVRHSSHCLTNWPFNDDDEYFNDQLFIGFEYEF